MKKFDYCRLELVTEEKDKKNKLHYWVVFLFTNEGLVETMKSESWIEREGGAYYETDRNNYKSTRTQRAIMMSKLGSDGWEWIEGTGWFDTFKRSKDE